MRRTLSARRRAISPVLATVILIAITLVAAVAVAGFVFGLMGTFSSIAMVSAQSAACSGTPEVCMVVLQNTGSGNTYLIGSCTMNLGGVSYQGTATLASGSLAGGNSATVRCTSNVGSSHASPGSQIDGSIAVGSGAQVFFVTLAQ